MLNSTLILNMGPVGSVAFSHRANILKTESAFLTACPMVSIQTELQKKSSEKNPLRKDTRVDLVEQYVPAFFVTLFNHFGDPAGH